MSLDRDRSLTLLFDPEHALDERIAMEQFATLTGLVFWRWARSIGASLPREVLPGSSAVERSTVNRMVACSNQARGAISFAQMNEAAGRGPDRFGEVRSCLRKDHPAPYQHRFGRNRPEHFRPVSARDSSSPRSPPSGWRCRPRRWCRCKSRARWRSGRHNAARRPWDRCPTALPRRTAGFRPPRRSGCG